MDAPTLALCTGARMDRAQLYAAALTDAMERFEIDTPHRIACFLATVAIESDHLTCDEEGLSYSNADRLCKVFPSLFVPSKGGKNDPNEYIHDPTGLSELRYNGCHGRGLIQLTREQNYRAAGEALGLDFITNPDSLLEPANAALTAAWFFAEHAKCLADADTLDMYAITGKVNGPARLKLDERSRQMIEALKALGT